MDTFPDPFNSPAHYTRSLAISSLAAITTATTDGFPWVRSFNSIVELAVDTQMWHDGEVSLVQLRGLSPILKSLRVDRRSIPLSEVFNLTCSFPLLEDLSLRSSFEPSNYNPISDPRDTPLTSPKLTGTLLLERDSLAVMHRLLDLPGGLRFSKVVVDCFDSSVGLLVDLVSRCSDTLESLCINFHPSGAFHLLPVVGDNLPLTVYVGTPGTSPPLDLSKVTKLKRLEFQWHTSIVQWITSTIQTVESPHLRQITVAMSTSASFDYPIEEAICREWQDLDRLLFQLWTSRSILPKITYVSKWCADNLGVYESSLVPELTSRGAVIMVQ